MKNKEKRIRKIEQSIKNKLFPHISAEDMKNESVKSMLVGVQSVQYDNCRTLSAEHKALLDSLLDKANNLRLKYLKENYDKFSNNPDDLAAVFGKFNDKKGEWKFNANNANGKAFKESLNPKITDAEINKTNPQTNSAFTESVMMSIGKDIAGFLDKWYSIKGEITKTDEDNKKKVVALPSDITFPALPGKFGTKTEVDAYNLAVSQINMVINEKINQVSPKDKQAKYLDRLKGFPSFPLVEKKENELTSEQAEKQINGILNKYTSAAKTFWEGLSSDKLEEILDKNYSRTSAQREISEWLRKTFAFHKDMKKVYSVVFAKVQNKIEGLAKHMKEKPDDKVAKQKYWNWRVDESMLLLEALRNNNFDEFIKVRSLVDFLISSAKGFWVKKDVDEKSYEITGFSAAKKAALAMFEYTDKDGKPRQQWALVFNHFAKTKFNISKKQGANTITGFMLDTSKKEYIEENGKQIRLYVYDKMRKTYKHMAANNIVADKDKTIILPIAIGKHYGRQYLYDNLYNHLNKKTIINNARIIKCGDSYWAALTFTKVGLPENNSFNDKYEYIIGIDRGENIPVVATITDLQGKRIETIELGAAHKKAQDKVAKEKAEQQREAGGYSDKLAHRAKNISDKTIERIAIDLLYLASKYRGLLVMEDLSRGFGRHGKKTIVSNNQYTRIEDSIANKLKINGLSRKGTTVCNCRDGLVAKVQAAHTSMTCGKCGYVHRKENIDLDTMKKENGVWHIIMSGKDFLLDLNYRGWKGRPENANAKIDELVKNKEVATLSDTNKDKVQKIIKSVLSPRQSQESFVCPICGHKDNADANASLNIARRWIFEKEDEVNAMSDGSFKKDKKYETRNAKSKKNKDIPYAQLWVDYCKTKADEWKQNN
jgi:transposase